MADKYKVLNAADMPGSGNNPKIKYKDMGDGTWAEVVVFEGSGSGEMIPVGTDRQVLGYENGTPVAVTLGWAQFSDQPNPPTFANGALIMSAELDPDNPEFGFVEVQFDLPKPNTLVMRNPDGGAIRAGDAVDDNELVTLGQLNAILAAL